MESPEDSSAAQRLRPPLSCDDNVCTACLQTEQDLRLLPCLHTLCRSCIAKLCECSQYPSDQLRCPSCLLHYSLSSSFDPSSLPTNSLCAAQAAGSSCQECSDEAETDSLTGSWLCVKCEVVTCDRHLAAHMRSLGPHAMEAFPATADYKPMDGSARSTSVLCRRYSTCAEHGEPLKFFCDECDVAVCGTCTAVGRHSQHQPVRPVCDVAKERMESAIGFVEHLRQALWRAERAAETLAESKRKVSVCAKELRDEIRASTNQVIEDLRDCEKELLDRVDSEEEYRRKLVDEHRSDNEAYQGSLLRAIRFGEGLHAAEVREPDVALAIALERRAADLCLRESFVSEVQSGQQRTNWYIEKLSVSDLCSTVRRAIGEVHMPGDVSAKNTVLKSCTGVVVKTVSPCVYCLSVGQESQWEVVIKDSAGERIRGTGNVVSIQWASPSSTSKFGACGKVTAWRHPPTARICDEENGTYRVNIMPQEAGVFLMKVRVNGIDILPNVHIECVFSEVNFDAKSLRHFPRFDIKLSEGDRKVVVQQTDPKQHYLVLFGEQGFVSGRHTWAYALTAEACFLGVVQGKVDPNHLELCGWDRVEQRLVWQRHINSKKERVKSSLPCWKEHEMLRLDLDCGACTLKITNLCSNDMEEIEELPSKELFPVLILFNPKRGSCVSLM